MYWSSSWARILNVRNIKEKKGKNQGDKFKYIFDVYMYSFHHLRRCWPSLAGGVRTSTFEDCRMGLANIHSILAYNVPRTDDVGLPTKLRFDVGQALQTIAGSMPVNGLRRCLNTNPSLGLLYIGYFGQTRGIHPMLFQY